VTISIREQRIAIDQFSLESGFRFESERYVGEEKYVTACWLCWATKSELIKFRAPSGRASHSDR